jgi:hypothetical protein
LVAALPWLLSRRSLLNCGTLLALPTLLPLPPPPAERGLTDAAVGRAREGNKESNQS